MIILQSGGVQRKKSPGHSVRVMVLRKGWGAVRRSAGRGPSGNTGGHGKVVIADRIAAVAPGGVDVVLRAVQRGHGPDVIPLNHGGAVDSLQLQKQVVGPGVSVADGGPVGEQAVGNMTEGVVPGLVLLPN